jgi:hypothetical protein
MISRWTDFLNTDGEKEYRKRDEELRDYSILIRTIFLARWERGWKRLFETLDSLTEDDLMKTVTIRNQPHTVIEAINRQLTHYGYHVGQIVFIGKHLESTNWKSLSIPRGKSTEFNDKMKK